MILLRCYSFILTNPKDLNLFTLTSWSLLVEDIKAEVQSFAFLMLTRKFDALLYTSTCTGTIYVWVHICSNASWLAIIYNGIENLPKVWWTNFGKLLKPKKQKGGQRKKVARVSFKITKIWHNLTLLKMSIPWLILCHNYKNSTQFKVEWTQEYYSALSKCN